MVRDFQELSNEKLRPWEVDALVAMHDALVAARREGPRLPPLTMEDFDLMFNPGG